MSEVLQTNIFFVITSIVVVLLAIMIVIALYYIIRILRAVKDVAERVRKGSEIIAEDAAQLRVDIVSGTIFSNIIGRIVALAGLAKKAAPKRRTKKVVYNETKTGEDPTDQ